MTLPTTLSELVDEYVFKLIKWINTNYTSYDMSSTETTNFVDNDDDDDDDNDKVYDIAINNFLENIKKNLKNCLMKDISISISKSIVYSYRKWF